MWKSELKAKNKTKERNELAVSILIYSFDVTEEAKIECAKIKGRDVT